MPSGTIAAYSYDPFGRRIEKRVTENGVTTTTRYLYDNEDILAEYDDSNTITNRYTHGPGIDEPLALTTAKESYYYHADGLGSIVAMTDASGKVVQTYEYDSFGNLKDLKNRIKQPYSYTGREYDRETHLYYYRARYYDAQVGRFVSKDSISFAGGDVNLYGYVQNNSINGIDPFGKAAFWYHYLDGFRIGYSMRDGYWDGLAMGHLLGMAAMYTDFNPETQHDPKYHATTNDETTAKDSIARSLTLASEQWQSCTVEGMGNAIHIWRDVVSHAGSFFPDPNPKPWDYTNHFVLHDLLPGGSFNSVILQRIKN